ncbi:MAG: putative baseplate assembly protein [Solirubrobacteraceae bacterium]
MTIARVRLDARSRSDLTADARQRLQLACPELSVEATGDPGAALVELFGWMTGLAIDRLAQIPEKLQVALLDLLGIQLDGPAAARSELRLRLSAPASEPLDIHPGTEVGTRRTATHESIVFTLQDDFTILPLRPAAYVIERGGILKEIGVADGVAHPPGPDQFPFGRPPRTGDALYLGFEHSLARLLMSVSMEASMARGAGVKPEDPPLRWECSQGEGTWAEVGVLADLTGGFNYGSGTVELQCPASSRVEPIMGLRMHWLRCRIADTTLINHEPAVYTQPPQIFQITAAPIGALLPAENSTPQLAETLGISDGSPGQTFNTRFAPMLPLVPPETLEVQTPTGVWEPWEERDTFADSQANDRHFTLDRVHGLIALGPELRAADGASIRHGAIPPKGAALRLSRYRHGGGSEGNVGGERLTTLRSAIPGVASVTNPVHARGGVAPQSLRSVCERSPLEIRTRYRAVTAEDYEFLATEATPRVARARRVNDGVPGVALQILPRVDPANRRLTIEELTPDKPLLDEIDRYLDARKLVGTPVRLDSMRFRAVSVVVNLQASPRADVQRIERDVRQSLYEYLNPLIGGTAGSRGDGWPAGRSLNQGNCTRSCTRSRASSSSRSCGCTSSTCTRTGRTRRRRAARS